MDEHDFRIPSPKRQRTNSPESGRVVSAPLLQNVSIAESETPALNAVNVADTDKTSTAATEALPPSENSMLDTLMQHVEFESNPDPTLTHVAQITSPIYTSHAPASTDSDVVNEDLGNDEDRSNHDYGRVAAAPNLPENLNNKLIHATSNDTVMDGSTSNVSIPNQDQSHILAASSEAVDTSSISHETQELENGVPSLGPDQETQLHQDTVSEMAQAAMTIDGIPPMLDGNQAADGVDQPEWEVDSSPYESSTDSDSSDDSSDDDSDEEDADGDYAMLDPEEQARILMQGDGGSDDEGDKSKTKGESAGLKTANEKVEDVLPIPDITITEDMKVEELGEVEGVVDKIVLIKAKVSGEYQVLDSGSLLCLEDRKIAGVVAELLGRVEQPMYMVRFRSVQEIEERGLLQKGTKVLYVPSHSSFVFTQPLKAVKGSDASNFHDEEVGDDEMEFSDDDAEAQHKRNLKLKRQGKLPEGGRGRGSTRGGRGGRGGRPEFEQSRDLHGAAYGNGSLEMNYDDDKDGEEGYTPLARPSNLQGMMDSAQPLDTPETTMLPPFSSQDRARGRGGRGGRDRGRGGRGRGQNRGGPHGPNRQSHDRSQYQSPSQAQATDYQHPTFPFPPPPPMLTPQSHGFPGSIATSPMSPLPNQQFTFGMGFQGSQNYGSNGYYNQQQQQQQQQPYQPPAPGFNQQQQNAYFNPAGMQQYNSQPPQQNGGFQNGWQNNQAAIAEVQRQLEQMRRSANGGHQQ